MGLGKVWFEAQGLLVAGHRLRQFPLLRKRHSKVIMGFGIVRFEAQGLLVAATASVSFPCSTRAIPRLLCASANPV